jgi:Family of unknown function (DUF6308)
MYMMIAGQRVDDPLTHWIAYGARRRTATSLRRYDFAPRGAPDILTVDEAARSRIIISHVTNIEAAWFASQSRSAPWSDVSIDADLRDADPKVNAGLYDHAVSLYRHFLDAAPKGIRGTKVHKVLHVKRPALFPVMDDRLWSIYRAAAAETARELANVRPGYELLYWAAVRNDLLNESNRATLAKGHAELAQHDGIVGQMAGLTDLRLLDIIAWRVAA